MITDALIGAGLAVWNFVKDLLPTGHLTLPGAGSVGTALGAADSLVPILGPLAAAVAVLSALVVFVSVRVVLVVINIVWP